MVSQSFTEKSTEKHADFITEGHRGKIIALPGVASDSRGNKIHISKMIPSAYGFFH
jgi:hypothetical protein